MGRILAALALALSAAPAAAVPAERAHIYFCELRRDEPGATLSVQRRFGAEEPAYLWANWYVPHDAPGVRSSISWHSVTGNLAPPGDGALVLITVPQEGLPPRERVHLELRRDPSPDYAGDLVVAGTRARDTTQLSVAINLGDLRAFVRGQSRVRYAIVARDGHVLREGAFDPPDLARPGAMVEAATPAWLDMARDYRHRCGDESEIIITNARPALLQRWEA